MSGRCCSPGDQLLKDLPLRLRSVRHLSVTCRTPCQSHYKTRGHLQRHEPFGNRLLYLAPSPTSCVSPTLCTAETPAAKVPKLSSVVCHYALGPAPVTSLHACDSGVWAGALEDSWQPWRNATSARPCRSGQTIKFWREKLACCRLPCSHIVVATRAVQTYYSGIVAILFPCYWPLIRPIRDMLLVPHNHSVGPRLFQSAMACVVRTLLVRWSM